MQKLIERILERINLIPRFSYACVKGDLTSVLEVVEIIEQEAKKGSWIYCIERMPSSEEYQKCNGQFIVTDGNRTYATYFDIYDTLKFGEPTMTGFKIDRCVIAWQPLPEKPEQEER